jgi:uncharacterized protein YjbI with pentapeptide repeats
VFSTTREVDDTVYTLETDLTGANLSSANFQASSLASANLGSANLSRANLRYADLRQSDLSQANLFSADLRGSNLQQAILVEANLSGTNIAGANLTDADLSIAKLNNVTFISTSSVNFPTNLSFNDFVTNLISSDCLNGYFLLRSNGALSASRHDLTDNLGRRFYDSGDWRKAVLYVCSVNLSNVKMRDETPWDLYLAGVNMDRSDLKFTNLSQAILDDFIQIDGLDYFLEADLTGITYNEFTAWPPGFYPPPSSPSSDFSP